MVSLVPSLTEAVAVTCPELLVGATDWCTHPTGLDVLRVGGTKYPDLSRIRAAGPDLVLANAEENRREDVEALRAAGVPVWVTYPRTVPEALTSLGRMFDRLGAARPDWLRTAAEVWAEPAPPAIRAIIPVWRRPWIVLGGDTFAADVLARLGVHNVFANQPRYPRPTLEAIRARTPELLVLPDEPYAFTAADAFQRYALVSGRHLTWYGPSLVEARALLDAQLRAATEPSSPADPAAS